MDSVARVLMERKDSVRPWYVYGNWKLHGSVKETESYFQHWGISSRKTLHVGLAVPLPFLWLAAEKAASHGVWIGAQDCSARLRGSFTGEVSAAIERDAGASFVILGHYERRRFYVEDPFLIREKVLRAVDAQLQVVLCCGETLEERRKGQAREVLRWQLRETLKDISIPELLIAYEPGWAIGTGEAAEVGVVSEMLQIIQEEMDLLLPHCRTPLLYGGSVTAQNVTDYVTMKECSGVLVGTASISPANFQEILRIIP